MFGLRSASKEDVLIVTEDYEVKGTVFNIGFSKKNRFLSDLLNKANKNFIAVKDCEVTYRIYTKLKEIASVDTQKSE